MNQAEIETGLGDLGLRAGDVVILHASLSSLGWVEGGADAVVDAFLGVLGPSGTLVVPTFGDLGVIPAAAAARPEAVASIHPHASVAAIGGAAAQICRDHWKAVTAHGEGTPYLRIADLGGYVCLLGVDEDRNTTLHAVEALLELPYLRTTKPATFSTPEGPVTRSWSCFPGPHRDFIGLDRLLRERGIVRTGRIGRAAVRLMKSRQTIDCLLEVGRRDPAFALCDNPHCSDCVAQRAAIRRYRWRREEFEVVAAARLAGPAPAQIAAACRAAGVGAVELDRLGDTDLGRMAPEEVTRAVHSLREAGCEVAALRFGAPIPSPPQVLDLAQRCRVQRLVMPLGPAADEMAPAAAGAGCELSLCNLAHQGAEVFEALDRWRAQGLKVGLTFSPAAFARIGERPFLESFHRRLGRFVDQLVVEDATFDGTPTPLARGNGEIKELISILRCSGFDGRMVLGGAHPPGRELQQVAADFDHLLQSL